MKLGIPDDRDREFTQYFTDGYIANLAEAPAVPDVLLVPPDLPSRLTIRVQFVGWLRASFFFTLLIMFSSQSSNSTKRPLDDHLHPGEPSALLGWEFVGESDG